MKAIFIVGTGRTGTHFLTRLLSGFDKVVDPFNGEENGRLLLDIAKAAITHLKPSQESVDYYLDIFKRLDGQVFLDQSHPNLFFVQFWQSLLREVIFLYPKRPIHQVVSSMLQHQGVLSWYQYAIHHADSVPFPNQFLGLDTIEEIKTTPLHILCAKRYLAHENMFQQQCRQVGKCLRQISYESLIDNPEQAIKTVLTQDELSYLGRFTLEEQPQKESLSKYQSHLTEEQLYDIRQLDN